jgi:two-component system, chemotaxis family, sensor kinase CheA
MTKDPYRYFRVEARELVEALAEGTLQFEKNGEHREVVARMLRTAHTLKGAARVVKQRLIAERAHAIEEVLADHREGAAVPRSVVESLLRFIDDISAGVRNLDAIETPGAAVSPVREAAPAAAADDPIEAVRVDLSDVESLLEAVFEAEVQLQGVRQQLESLGGAAAALSSAVAHLTAPGQSERSAAKAVGMLDETKTLLDGSRRALTAGLDRADGELVQIRDAADRVRLIKASLVFGLLERTARDAAQAQGKQVRFSSFGGDARLDAHVLSSLRAALVQLVRNAVAHGIESPAERAAAGKPVVGHVTLGIERLAGHLRFSCQDDGGGIDLVGLEQQAIRRGILSGPLDSDHERERLLLAGGLSTRGRADELAGRGIGLDIVRDTVSKLRGQVTVHNARGAGVRIDISVPLSLSSVTVLQVESDGAHASLPLDAIRSAKRVTLAEIASEGEGRSIVHEGRKVPFLSLGHVLRRPPRAGRPRRAWSVVIVESGERVAALGVDRMLGTAHVAVRPLPAVVRADAVVAGASLDAEGEPRLVLDPAGLVAAAQNANVPFETGSEPGRIAPILVIDDSLTTRMLEKSILESCGYLVELACSAEEGLEKARAGRYSLFLVDVEMPGMTGFEFVRTTRADPTLSSVPAVLVTSRNSPDDLAEGRAAGASAHIVKTDFDQRHLLEVIRRVVGV